MCTCTIVVLKHVVGINCQKWDNGIVRNAVTRGHWGGILAGVHGRDLNWWPQQKSGVLKRELRCCLCYCMEDLSIFLAIHDTKAD